MIMDDKMNIQFWNNPENFEEENASSHSLDT